MVIRKFGYQLAYRFFWRRRKDNAAHLDCYGNKVEAYTSWPFVKPRTHSYHTCGNCREFDWRFSRLRWGVEFSFCFKKQHRLGAVFTQKFIKMMSDHSGIWTEVY